VLAIRLLPVLCSTVFLSWPLSVAVAQDRQAADADRPAAAEAFELRDGDRVVFLGDTFIERAAQYGYIETALTTRWPDRHVTFRNLGWSGDNVWARSRAGFGTVEDGFRQLRDQLRELKPTVVLLSYGANESYDGPEGLPRFVEGYRRMLAMLDEHQPRIVHFTPLKQESLGAPLPDPAAFNKNRKLYGEAIGQIAAERKERVIDLYRLLGDNAPPVGPLTDNGIHLTAHGYWWAALAIEHGLGLSTYEWHVSVPGDVQPAPRTPNPRRGSPLGTKIRDVTWSPNGARLVATDEQLPLAAAPWDATESTKKKWASVRQLRVTGLDAGRYTLKIDGQAIHTATAAQWAEGIGIASGPDFEQFEALQRAIFQKNELYFHRWRPQNNTYLFLFRKHEQGNNAVEIPQFDPLIEEREREIAKLRKPAAARIYELIRAEEEDAERE
jgi:lysophospholipase L1-like esterase